MFVATLSAALVVAGTLVGANVASADSVQVQSYGRASQTEACAAQVGETPWQASWGTDSSWKPSWEQWANAGKGGWTCGRSITWARDSAARTYALGDIGPGGGLVFFISGGLTYEMAPKNWSGASDPTMAWCSDTTHSVSTNDAIGTGAANTTAMLTSAGSFVACTLGAANAVRAYAGGGKTDWFLPSRQELNEMCSYSRNPVTPSTGECNAMPDATFANGSYGFTADYYWSSSQLNTNDAWSKTFDSGGQSSDLKSISRSVRPVRAF